MREAGSASLRRSLCTRCSTSKRRARHGFMISNRHKVPMKIPNRCATVTENAMVKRPTTPLSALEPASTSANLIPLVKALGMGWASSAITLPGVKTTTIVMEVKCAARMVRVRTRAVVKTTVIAEGANAATGSAQRVVAMGINPIAGCSRVLPKPNVAMVNASVSAPPARTTVNAGVAKSAATGSARTVLAGTSARTTTSATGGTCVATVTVRPLVGGGRVSARMITIFATAWSRALTISVKALAIHAKTRSCATTAMVRVRVPWTRTATTVCSVMARSSAGIIFIVSPARSHASLTRVAMKPKTYVCAPTMLGVTTGFTATAQRLASRARA
mmetsp:Transcript_2624/g.5346  ORF Transcript_2624/g.5346 Transcript_2624/m.5346 type:complete len:332 (+) Transcript_2624:2578-3573(+)